MRYCPWERQLGWDVRTRSGSKENPRQPEGGCGRVADAERLADAVEQKGNLCGPHCRAAIGRPLFVLCFLYPQVVGKKRIHIHINTNPAKQRADEDLLL